MKKYYFAFLTLGTAISAFGQWWPGPEDLSDDGNKDTPIISIMWVRGVQNSARVGQARGSNPNMVYHGGKIMTTVNAQAIFWGPTWGTAPADKISGLDSWYAGFGNSNYSKTVDEYTGLGLPIGNSLNYSGHIVDTSTATGGSSASAILTEVCKRITNLDHTGNGYYPVYVDVKRGNAQYCAWHSAGTCSGVPVQFAFFFNLDGDPGCDPQSTVAGHSQGLAALANVSAHELSEARTDPSNPGAWYDNTGAENGDKCAWTFNVPYVTFTNNTSWKVQGEWSNKAYTSGPGYPNSSGQRGCVDGH